MFRVVLAKAMDIEEGQFALCSKHTPLSKLRNTPCTANSADSCNATGRVEYMKYKRQSSLFSYCQVQFQRIGINSHYLEALLVTHFAMPHHILLLGGTSKKTLCYHTRPLVPSDPI